MISFTSEISFLLRQSFIQDLWEGGGIGVYPSPLCMNPVRYQDVWLNVQKYDFQKMCLGCISLGILPVCIQVEEDEFDETREEDQLAATQEREDHEMTGSDFSDAESTQDEEEGEEGAEEESEGTEAEEEDEETDYLEVSISLL